MSRAVAMLAGLLVFTALTASAEDARQRAARARTVRSTMNQVVSLLRTDPRQAIAAIKALVQEYPEEKQFLYEKLGYAYTVASMPDSAKAAYEACVALEPLQLSAARELAQLYIARGEKGDAERLFSDMLRRTPNRVQAYRAVSQAQVAAGWHVQALETCHRARAELNSPDAFALDIGDLEKMAGNTERALEEYLLYLGNKQADLQTGQKKILELVQDPRTTDTSALIVKLETHSRSGDGDYRRRVLEILSQMYLQANLLENALEAGLAADGLSVSNGQQLYELIQLLSGRYEECGAHEKARLMDLCLRASDAYLLRHPRTAEAAAVHLVRSSMLVERGAGCHQAISREERSAALAAAVEELDYVMKNFPGTRFSERAALLKGDVYLRYLDKEEALRIYQRGMKGAVEYPAAFAENIAKALCALGRYDDGKRHCSSLMRSKNATLADTGFYYMGLMLVCTGAYEAARDTLTALAEHRPASAYTNDAIDLAWVIELGLRLDPEHLDAYGSILKSDLAGDSTAVLRGLEAFAGMPAGTPLRPRALYELGVWYADTGEYQKALSTFSGFLEEYPEDALAPEAERRMGGVYEHGLGDREQAMKRYEHVLMVYPKYVFLDEVRRDVVRLREPGKAE